MLLYTCEISDLCVDEHRVNNYNKCR